MLSVAGVKICSWQPPAGLRYAVFVEIDSSKVCRIGAPLSEFQKPSAGSASDVRDGAAVQGKQVGPHQGRDTGPVDLAVEELIYRMIPAVESRGNLTGTAQLLRTDPVDFRDVGVGIDRKSTRLNS